MEEDGIYIRDNEDLYELDLSNVQPNDTGIYTCYFNNTLIPMETNGTINVSILMAEREYNYNH